MYIAGCLRWPPGLDVCTQKLFLFSLFDNDSNCLAIPVLFEKHRCAIFCILVGLARERKALSLSLSHFFKEGDSNCLVFRLGACCACFDPFSLSLSLSLSLDCFGIICPDPCICLIAKRNNFSGTHGDVSLRIFGVYEVCRRMAVGRPIAYLAMASFGGFPLRPTSIHVSLNSHTVAAMLDVGCSSNPYRGCHHLKRPLSFMPCSLSSPFSFCSSFRRSRPLWESLPSHGLSKNSICLDGLFL